MRQTNNRDFVILVDHEDQEIGYCEKLKAHEFGYLHRAFSIFLFNDQQELLMQKRAYSKYHSGGLWTNTVCSHPTRGINLVTCAQNRLTEELGIREDMPELTMAFPLLYRQEVDKGLIEHEYDHVLLGRYNDIPLSFNPDEVDSVAFFPTDKIDQQLKATPEEFTIWFQLLWPKIAEHLHSASILSYG